MQDTLLFMCKVILIAVYTVSTSITVVECSQYNNGAEHRMSQIEWCGAVYKLVFKNGLFAVKGSI
jgi:hypothetical protein